MRQLACFSSVIFALVVAGCGGPSEEPDLVWGKQGETCGQYLAKGRQAYIEGSIRTRSYDDKNGQKRYVTEIIAQRVRFLGGGGGTRVAPEAETDSPAEAASGASQAPFDDDIPF